MLICTEQEERSEPQNSRFMNNGPEGLLTFIHRSMGMGDDFMKNSLRRFFSIMVALVMILSNLPLSLAEELLEETVPAEETVPVVSEQAGELTEEQAGGPSESPADSAAPEEAVSAEPEGVTSVEPEAETPTEPDASAATEESAAPEEQAVVEETPAEEATAEEVPEAPAEEAPAAEVPEAPAGEISAEEPPVASAEEAPVEEVPEAPAEEAPAEETAEVSAPIPAESEEEAGSTEVPEAEAAGTAAEEVPAEEVPEAPVEEASTEGTPAGEVTEAPVSVPTETEEETANPMVPETEVIESAAEEAPAEEKTEVTEAVPAETTEESSNAEVPETDAAETVNEEVPATEGTEVSAEEEPEAPEVTPVDATLRVGGSWRGTFDGTREDFLLRLTVNGWQAVRLTTDGLPVSVRLSSEIDGSSRTFACKYDDEAQAWTSISADFELAEGSYLIKVTPVQAGSTGAVSLAVLPQPAAEGEKSAEEEAPAEEAIPAEGEAPAENETPIEEDTPAEEKTPVEDETPAEGEAPAEDETPAEEDVSVEEETPAAEEDPAEDETPAENETSAEEEVPVEGETPAEEAPAEGETPAENETPAEEEAPVEEGTPAEEEAPVDGETPAKEETPVENEISEEEKISAEKDASAENETPAEAGNPVENVMPVEEENSEDDEAPAADENPTEDEIPAVNETSAVGAPAEDEMPAEEETLAAEEATALLLTGEAPDGSTVAVVAAPGVLPENTRIRVTSVDKLDIARKILLTLGYATDAERIDENDLNRINQYLLAYAVGFEADGVPVRPAEPVEVTISGIGIDRDVQNGGRYMLWDVSGDLPVARKIDREDDSSVVFQLEGGTTVAICGAVSNAAPAAVPGRRLMKAVTSQTGKKTVGVGWFDNYEADTANYITVDNAVPAANGKAAENGTYTGSVSGAIPASKLFGWTEGHLEDTIAGTALKNFYPHGDGKNIIGGVLFDVTFPAGAVIDFDHITENKGTAAFSKVEKFRGAYKITNKTNSGCFGTSYDNSKSYDTSKNAVTFLFTFTDSNFEGIYAAYNRNPDAIISFNIPYTMDISADTDLESLGKITAKGQTWMHITSSLQPAYIYTNVFTDDAAQPGYQVSYEFVYTGNAYDEIPEGVLSQLPEDETINEGVFTPQELHNVTDETTGKMWTFVGWTPESSENTNMHFVGTWYYGVPAYRAVYQFINGADETVPVAAGLNAFLPADVGEDGETINQYDTVSDLKAVNPLPIQGEGLTEENGIITWQADETGLTFWQTKGYEGEPVVDEDALTVTYTVKWYEVDLAKGYWHVNDGPWKPYEGTDITATGANASYWTQFTTALTKMTAEDTMYINGTLPDGQRFTVPRGKLVVESDVTMNATSYVGYPAVTLSGGTVMTTKPDATFKAAHYRYGVQVNANSALSDGNYDLNSNEHGFYLNGTGALRGLTPESRDTFKITLHRSDDKLPFVMGGYTSVIENVTLEASTADVATMGPNTGSTDASGAVRTNPAVKIINANVSIKNVFFQMYGWDISGSHFVYDGSAGSAGIFGRGGNTPLNFYYGWGRTSTWSNSTLDFKNCNYNIVTTSNQYLKVNGCTINVNSGSPAVLFNIRREDSNDQWASVDVVGTTINFKTTPQYLIGGIAQYPGAGSSFNFGANSVVNTPASTNEHNAGGDGDLRKFTVTGGSHKIYYAPSYNSSYGSIRPVSGYGTKDDLLSYFKLADPSLTELSVEYEDGQVRTYSVAKASDDGNKYVWAPATAVYIHATDAEETVTTARFRNGRTVTEAYNTIRGMKINDVVRYNAISDNRTAFDKSLIEGLTAQGYIIVGWVYKVDAGEVRTLIDTGEEAVSAEDACDAITGLNTTGERVDIYPVWAASGPETVTIQYSFVAKGTQRELPDEIKAAEPEDITAEKGEQVTLVTVEKTTVEEKVDGVTAGTWTFTGWRLSEDSDPITAVTPTVDTVVTGTWTFAPAGLSARYTFAPAAGSPDFTKDNNYEADQTALADKLPGTATVSFGSQAKPAEIAEADQTVNGTYGTWTFKGWRVKDADGNLAAVPDNGQTVTTAGVEFIGLWEYTHDTHTVGYLYLSKDGSPLPEQVTAKTAELTQVYAKPYGGENEAAAATGTTNDGTVVKVLQPKNMTTRVNVTDGTWVMIENSWKLAASSSVTDADELQNIPEAGVTVTADVWFTALWRFVPNTTKQVRLTLHDGISEANNIEYILDPTDEGMMKLPVHPFGITKVKDGVSYRFMGWRGESAQFGANSVTYLYTDGEIFRFNDPGIILKPDENTPDNTGSRMLDWLLSRAYADEEGFTLQGDLYAVWLTETPAVTAKTELNGDLLVNGDTEHDAVPAVKTGDEVEISAVLDATAVKNQIEAIYKTYDERRTGTLNMASIRLAETKCVFTVHAHATGLDLSALKAEDLSLDATVGPVNGADFRVTGLETGEGENDWVITISMVNPGALANFENLYELVHEKMKDSLVLTLKPRVTQSGGYARLTGSAQGTFFSLATLSGTDDEDEVTGHHTIPFNFVWNGVQAPAGSDKVNPGPISVSMLVSPVVELPGDLQVKTPAKGDAYTTEHEQVYVTKPGATLNYAALLNVSEIKGQIIAEREYYEGQAGGQGRTLPLESITLSDLSSSFTVKLTAS